MVLVPTHPMPTRPKYKADFDASFQYPTTPTQPLPLQIKDTKLGYGICAIHCVYACYFSVEHEHLLITLCFALLFLPTQTNTFTLSLLQCQYMSLSCAFKIKSSYPIFYWYHFQDISLNHLWYQNSFWSLANFWHIFSFLPSFDTSTILKVSVLEKTQSIPNPSLKGIVDIKRNH